MCRSIDPSAGHLIPGNDIINTNWPHNGARKRSACCAICLHVNQHLAHGPCSPTVVGGSTSLITHPVQCRIWLKCTFQSLATMSAITTHSRPSQLPISRSCRCSSAHTRLWSSPIVSTTRMSISLITADIAKAEIHLSTTRILSELLANFKMY